MKSRLHYSLATILTCIALACGATSVSAATISVQPPDSTVLIGDTFDIKITGQGFTEGAGGTLGGGFIIDWNPGFLALDSYSLTFPGDQAFAQVPVQDDVAGFLNADVSSFLTGAYTADFDIAVLTFTALSPGVSPLDLSIGTYPGGADLVWADSAGFEIVQPDFVDGSVTISAVPVPAAVWLFGSGLLGLIGIARRKAA
jgi:hypothetical protein